MWLVVRLFGQLGMPERRLHLQRVGVSELPYPRVPVLQEQHDLRVLVYRTWVQLGQSTAMPGCSRSPST